VLERVVTITTLLLVAGENVLDTDELEVLDAVEEDETIEELDLVEDEDDDDEDDNDDEVLDRIDEDDVVVTEVLVLTVVLTDVVDDATELLEDELPPLTEFKKAGISNMVVSA
jgi:hypothetical protein